MTLTRRQFAYTLAAAIGLPHPVLALAQDALEAIPDGPLREQAAWIIGILDDPDAVVTDEEMAAHFDEAFLLQVPAGQLVQVFMELRGQLRGVTVTGVELGPSGSDAAIGLVGNTGLALVMTIVVEPGSGLISGLFFQPGELTGSATDAEEAVASPAATPVAAITPAPTTDEILADYEAASGALGDAGRALTQASVAGDDATVKGLFSQSVAGLLSGFSAGEAMAELTTDVVSFALAEASAYFAAHYTPEGMNGLYHQGLPAAFRLAPDAPQGDVPAGLWTGEIVIGSFTLGIEVTFSGTAADFAATISIPEQGLSDHALSDVRFEAERPLGIMLDERALPLGASTGNASYGAVYEWGDMALAINSGFNEANEAIAITAVMQPPLPPDPSAGVPVTTTAWLPFEGAWVVLWGGETEFRNYHAPSPLTRHANDILIWRDGATYSGDGTRNEQYHCYGQPQYAPAAGTVIVAVDGHPDEPPGVGSAIDPSVDPIGNHIVIEVADDEYLVMAHFQPGSVAVREGDVVATGDLVGLTGNSGRSSEPHVHIHLQTSPDVFDSAAIGLPLAFTGFTVNGELAEAGTLLQGQVVEHASA